MRTKVFGVISLVLHIHCRLGRVFCRVFQNLAGNSDTTAKATTNTPVPSLGAFLLGDSGAHTTRFSWRTDYCAIEDDSRSKFHPIEQPKPGNRDALTEFMLWKSLPDAPKSRYDLSVACVHVQLNDQSNISKSLRDAERVPGCLRSIVLKNSWTLKT